VFSSSAADDRFRDERVRDPRSGGRMPAAAGAARRGGTGGRPGRPGEPGRGEPGRGRGIRSGREPLEPLEPEVPVRRLLSIAVAGFSLLLAFGLLVGSQATTTAFSVVVFGAQVLFVLAWTVASRPSAARIVAGVGVLTAAAATISMNLPVEATLTPLAYVLAGGFVAGVVGQLFRRGGRAGVTESLAVTAMVVVGVTSFASLIVLDRRPVGNQVLMAGLVAAGVALATARICDILVPSPRLAPQVPRGSTGVVAGAMAGTAAAAAVGYAVLGLTTLTGALAGMVAALVAIVVDLGTGYAEAGRRLEGEAPSMWLARHMQGPVGAFAFAAPACYVMGVIVG